MNAKAKHSVNSSSESVNETELVKSILDFSFIVKGQIHSEKTAVMRSILNILIMEAEDYLENAALSETGPGEDTAGRFT